MSELEKVIKEWESVLSRDPLDAPWDLIDDTLAMLKEQQQQIWEFQDQVEYLTDKKKEQKFLVDSDGRITPLPVVVRCKDCKHGEPCKNGLGEDAIECFDSDICLEVRCRRPNWFCANGELKE